MILKLYKQRTGRGEDGGCYSCEEFECNIIETWVEEGLMEVTLVDPVE